jgi:hypothetical protein
VWDRDVLGAGAVSKHPQHLLGVRLRAREQLGAELRVLGHVELGDRRRDVLSHSARQVRDRGQQPGRDLLDRGSPHVLWVDGSHLPR